MAHVLPAAMLPLFHRESGPFCVDVCVMVSLFVQWNVSPMAPVAAAGSNPWLTPTIEVSTVAARASPATSSIRTAVITTAIDAACAPPSVLRSSTRRGPVRMVR